MSLLAFFRMPALFRYRGVPVRISTLVMAVQRSPLAVLLPEARVISTSGFSDFIAFTVTAIAGLGAFDSVSGASTVAQVAPSPGSATVNGTGAQPFTFLFNYTGSDTPDHFQVTGPLPAGLTQTGSKDSKTDSITGVPLRFPVQTWPYGTRPDAGPPGFRTQCFGPCRGLRPRRVRRRLTLTASTMWPSACSERVGTRDKRRFRGSILCLYLPLSTLRAYRYR